MHIADFDDSWSDDKKYHWVAQVATASCLRNRKPQYPEPLPVPGRRGLAGQLVYSEVEIAELAEAKTKADIERRRMVVNELSALAPEERASLIAEHVTEAKELQSYIKRSKTPFVADPVLMRTYFDACWESISQKFVAPQV